MHLFYETLDTLEHRQAQLRQDLRTLELEIDDATRRAQGLRRWKLTLLPLTGGDAMYDPGSTIFWAPTREAAMVAWVRTRAQGRGLFMLDHLPVDAEEIP